MIKITENLKNKQKNWEHNDILIMRRITARDTQYQYVRNICECQSEIKKL